MKQVGNSNLLFLVFISDMLVFKVVGRQPLSLCAFSLKAKEHMESEESNTTSSEQGDDWHYIC